MTFFWFVFQMILPLSPTNETLHSRREVALFTFSPDQSEPFVNINPSRTVPEKSYRIIGLQGIYSSLSMLETDTRPKVNVVVVVYNVTIVAIGHGLLKKFWPFGTRLGSTHHCAAVNSII